MSSSRIVQVRKADANHQVVSVEGGNFAYRREPCGGCPWRPDNDGSFPAKAFEHSATTAYDMSRRIFSCHESGTEKQAVCAGFLLRGATHNLAIRLKLWSGELNLDEVSEAGQTLHATYRDMAEANGVPPDAQVLKPCR